MALYGLPLEVTYTPDEEPLEEREPLLCEACGALAGSPWIIEDPEGELSLLCSSCIGEPLESLWDQDQDPAREEPA